MSAEDLFQIIIFLLLLILLYKLFWNKIFPSNEPNRQLENLQPLERKIDYLFQQLENSNIVNMNSPISNSKAQYCPNEEVNNLKNEIKVSSRNTNQSIIQYADSGTITEELPYNSIFQPITESKKGGSKSMPYATQTEVIIQDSLNKNDLQEVEGRVINHLEEQIKGMQGKYKEVSKLLINMNKSIQSKDSYELYINNLTQEIKTQKMEILSIGKNIRVMDNKIKEVPKQINIINDYLESKIDMGMGDVRGYVQGVQNNLNSQFTHLGQDIAHSFLAIQNLFAETNSHNILLQQLIHKAILY